MRVFKGLLWAVVALLVALLAAFTWGRLRPPTPAQKAALEALHKDTRPTHGRNAYPLLWLVGFDIPADKLDAAYAKDRERMEAWYQSYEPMGQNKPAPQPHADFPALAFPTAAERKALCSMRDPDCLGKARAHNDALHALLAKHAKLLARDQALAGFDYAWNDMPKGPMVPEPPFNMAMGLWQTAVALDFVDGRQTQALDGACTQIATLRRLHAHSNSLIAAMVFAVRIRGGVMLFAQMLSEVPTDLPLPSSCATAFAPLTVEDVDLCPGIQAEFANVASPMVFGADGRWYEHLQLSTVLSKRLLAPSYASVCDATRTRQLLADETVPRVLASPSFDFFDVIANAAGTTLAHIARADWTPYLQRQQDTAATLRMGALILWLRDNHDDSRTLAQQLAARPAWMRFGADRKVSITPDGRGLTMQLRNDAQHDWPTTWPLPGNP